MSSLTLIHAAQRGREFCIAGLAIEAAALQQT